MWSWCDVPWKWNSEFVSVGDEGNTVCSECFCPVVVSSTLSLRHATSFGAWHLQRESEPGVQGAEVMGMALDAGSPSLLQAAQQLKTEFVVSSHCALRVRNTEWGSVEKLLQIGGHLPCNGQGTTLVSSASQTWSWVLSIFTLTFHMFQHFLI